MKTYVCDKCGKGFESSELLNGKKGMVFGLRKCICPECKSRMEPVVSGGSLIIFGLFIIIFSGLILDDIVWRYGAIAGGASIGLGILRAVKQLYNRLK